MSLPERVARLLHHHREPSSSALDAFLRLHGGYLLTRFVHPMRSAFQEGRAHVSEETWDWKEIEQLPPCHGRDSPACADDPIVLCRVNGFTTIVDGNNRRNLWTREQREECPVLLVTIAGEK